MEGSRKRLAIVLTSVFMLAMFLGPGPGLRLVNPDIDDPGARYTIGGLPIVYAWGLFWYAIQLTVIFIAYFTLWREDEAPTDANAAK